MLIHIVCLVIPLVSNTLQRSRSTNLMKAKPTTMQVELPLPPMPIPTTSSPTTLSTSSRSSNSSLSSSLRSKLSQKKSSVYSQPSPALMPPTPTIPRRNSSMHFLHKKQSTAPSSERNSRDHTELYDDGSLSTYPPPPPKEDADDER